MRTTDLLMNETERQKYKETDALQICPLCLSSLRQDIQPNPLIHREQFMLHFISINPNANMCVQLCLGETCNNFKTEKSDTFPFHSVRISEMKENKC